MVDIVDSATRSRMMGTIRGKDTKPEMTVRRYLHAAGLRYVLHDRTLPGKPDLVFPGRCLAVFVHGCFWHRHAGCRYATTPATRHEFWEKKFAANVDRDRRAVQALQDAGWTVITVWECETRSLQFLERLARTLKTAPVVRRRRQRSTVRVHGHRCGAPVPCIRDSCSLQVAVPADSTTPEESTDPGCCAARSGQSNRRRTDV